MSVKRRKRRKRPTCRRCCICRVWRPITEMITDSGTAQPLAPDDTYLVRFWECPTHTPKQEARMLARLRERWPEMKL